MRMTFFQYPTLYYQSVVGLGWIGLDSFRYFPVIYVTEFSQNMERHVPPIDAEIVK